MVQIKWPDKKFPLITPLNTSDLADREALTPPPLLRNNAFRQIFCELTYTKIDCLKNRVAEIIKFEYY